MPRASTNFLKPPKFLLICDELPQPLTGTTTKKRKMAEPPVAEVLTFPTDPTEFEGDDRISFSRLDSKYIAVQSDGTEFEFDHSLKRWIPLADEDDEDLFEQQQSAYAAAQEPSAAGGRQPGNSRKRKQDDVEVSCARWPIRSCPDDALKNESHEPPLSSIHTPS